MKTIDVVLQFLLVSLTLIFVVSVYLSSNDFRGRLGVGDRKMIISITQEGGGV